MAIELHETTRRLIADVFRGQTCADCGFEAQRFYRDKYYCADCADRSDEGTVRFDERRLRMPASQKRRYLRLAL